LHEKKIIHRGINPQSISFASKDKSDFTIKM
jgi:serine/threonine protein kinase